MYACGLGMIIWCGKTNWCTLPLKKISFLFSSNVLFPMVPYGALGTLGFPLTTFACVLLFSLFKVFL